MKEFKKWYKKVMRPQQERGSIIYECDCEKTWKAALEWVLGASQCSGDSADVFWDELRKRYIPVGCDVRDTIREELKKEGK